MPQVNQYKEKYKTLIFDNLGVGKSESPKGPYSVKMMADDTVALLDSLKISSCHLSGLSLGAAIAAKVAIDFPEKVKTLQLHAGHTPDPVTNSSAVPLYQTTRVHGSLGPNAGFLEFADCNEHGGAYDSDPERYKAEFSKLFKNLFD